MTTPPIAWTEFLPASLPGSSRIHLAEVNPFNAHILAVCRSVNRGVSFVEAHKRTSAYLQSRKCQACRDRVREIHAQQWDDVSAEYQAHMTADALAAWQSRRDQVMALQEDVMAYATVVRDRVRQIATNLDSGLKVYPHEDTVPFPRVKAQEELDTEAGIVRETPRPRMMSAEEYAAQPNPLDWDEDDDYTRNEIGDQSITVDGREFIAGATRVQLVSAGDPQTAGTVYAIEPGFGAPAIRVIWEGQTEPGAMSYHPSQLRIVETMSMREGLSRLTTEQGVQLLTTGRVEIEPDDRPLLDRIDHELQAVKDQAQVVEAWAVDASGAPFVPGVTRVLLADEDTSTNRVSVPEPGTVVQSGRGHVHVVWGGDPTSASYTYAAGELKIVTPARHPGDVPEVQNRYLDETPGDLRRAASPVDAALQAEEAIRIHGAGGVPQAVIDQQAQNETHQLQTRVWQLTEELGTAIDRLQEAEDLLVTFKRNRTVYLRDSVARAVCTWHIRKLATLLRLPES